MNTLFNTVRHKVSADKNRYKEGTFDLDLTYITDRIVGTSHNKKHINYKKNTHNETKYQFLLFI